MPVQAPPPEDLAFCGALEYYDKSFDRVTPKTERPLKKTTRAFRSVTTSDDPVIRRAPLAPLLLLLLAEVAWMGIFASAPFDSCSPETRGWGVLLVRTCSLETWEWGVLPAHAPVLTSGVLHRILDV